MKTYIKKILGVLLCFCFLIGSNLCTFAVGDDDASIWVGDVRLYDGDSTTAFGGTASYAGGILTLNGVTVPKTKFHNDAAIYTEYDLTIKLMGTNTVTGPDVDAGSYGIHAYGVNLTFTGNGSLASHGGITSVVSLMYSCGISTRGSDKAANISIYDSVSILSTGDEGYYSNGVYCGELSIFSIAKLTAIGAADGALCAKSCGVQASLLIINGGELLARGNVACKLYGLVPEAFPYIFGSTDINAAIDTLAEAAYSETDQSIRINYAAAKTVLIRDMYTVTFNPNGATGVMNPMDCAKYDSFYMPECGFDTPAGCYFKYWTINSPDGKTINAHESLLLNGDITLYPFWASLEAPQITSSEYYDYPKNTESSIPLSASGTAPIVWSLASGSSLPTGLSLNPATGQIYGTTTAAEGYYDFTVTATNSKGSDSKAVTLCIVDDYSVSIGNKILKSGNSTTAFGGTASFNNGVLTLNNVTVTAENTNDDAQIYSLFPLTINLIGNNKMTGRNYGGDLGIHVCGDLTFKGNGSLEITSCNYISRSLNKGIYVEGNLLLTEQAAVISNSGAVGNANYNSYGADVKGNITLSDSSSLTVKSARSNYAYGLYCRENLTIKDNAVLNSSAQGFSDNASYGASILGNVTISGGRLTSIGLTKGIDTRVNSSVILSERLIVMGKTSAVENEGQLTRAFFAACNLQDETVYTQGTYDNPSGKALTVKIFEPEELTVSDDEFSIPDSVVNNPINEIDIASYVSGGILPYHFELSVAPEWLSISENGILSGTPTQVADLATAKVIITDSAATAANVTVTVTIGDIVSEPTFSDGYYLIHNAAHLYWFAAKVNAGNTGYNARLMKDIELNPGYTFAFDPDTGLVEMKKDGVAAGYFGTDKAGDENGNTIFDTTASGIGAFYPSKDSANAGTLTESPLTWMPIENYTGTFDGNGKTVSGIYFNDPDKHYIGLFGYSKGNGKSIKNLTVADSCIIAADNVGSVCGYKEGTGTITSCTNTGVVIGSDRVSGICGYFISGTIHDCSNTGTVIGTGQNIGGVCGYASGNATIQYCYNTGAVIGDLNTGGVCGYASGNATIQYCYNTGMVIGDSNTGGVCGYSDNSEIQYCYNTGAVSGDLNIGGVCGSDGGTIQYCFYLDSLETDFFEGTFYATAEDFADGKVTYLLNDSRSEGTKEDPLVWYQNIDNGETPDTSPKFTGGTVYYVPELSKYSNYPDETPTEIISVTITWGAMEFTYIDASEGTWNPDTLSYENPTPAVWTCDADANKITVTSESNVELTALFIYEQAEGVTVNGSFTDGTNPITDALPLAKGNETPQTVVAYLKLDGKPSRDIDAKLGTATITINEISKKAAG